MSRPPTARFTLTDLCVVLAVGALSAGVLFPSVVRLSGGPPRLRCASNLRQISQGIQMYANENKGNFPRALYDPQAATATEYTHWQSPDPFQFLPPGPNDVTAALFLLLRTQELESNVFICPSVSYGTAWDFGRRRVTQVSNFPGRQHLNYSYTNPYHPPMPPERRFAWGEAPSTEYAIAADMNPGGATVVNVAPTSAAAETRLANSANHGGDGQNVLYVDGHVEFQDTPFCGMPRSSLKPPSTFRDNIYTFGATWGATSGAGTNGTPVDDFDSVLLPTALDGPAPAVPAEPSTLLLRGIIAAGVVGLLLLAVALRYRKPVAATPSIR